MLSLHLTRLCIPAPFLLCHLPAPPSTPILLLPHRPSTSSRPAQPHRAPSISLPLLSPTRTRTSPCLVWPFRSFAFPTVSALPLLRSVPLRHAPPCPIPRLLFHPLPFRSTSPASPPLPFPPPCPYTSFRPASPRRAPSLSPPVPFPTHCRTFPFPTLPLPRPPFAPRLPSHLHCTCSFGLVLQGLSIQCTNASAVVFITDYVPTDLSVPRCGS